MADQARLAVRLTPGASADRLDGWDSDAGGRAVLKARVQARPVEGAANRALLELLAGRLGVARSALLVERGGQSRIKRVLVTGLTQEEARARLTDL